MKKPVNAVRRLGVLAGIVALTIGGTSSVLADPNWPSKPVTIIVPFPAGGGTDAFARPLSAQLTKQMGKQIIIDNRFAHRIPGEITENHKHRHDGNIVRK